MPPVLRLPQFKPSSMNLLPTCNLPSFKLYWKTPTLMTEVLEPAQQVNLQFSKMKSATFSAKADSSLNLGNAPLRTIPVSTWA